MIAHFEVVRTLVVQVRVSRRRVKDDVEWVRAVLFLELLDERTLLVVEDLVRAERLDEVARGGRAGRDDVGFVGARDL